MPGCAPCGARCVNPATSTTKPKPKPTKITKKSTTAAKKASTKASDCKTGFCCAPKTKKPAAKTTRKVQVKPQRRSYCRYDYDTSSADYSSTDCSSSEYSSSSYFSDSSSDDCRRCSRARTTNIHISL